ncbi:hypothetical protein [Marinitenerispora sediminis]|nr:hypothetical protein [Marinitenerispora sediminis]
MVSANNVAQASRFTVSYEVLPEDIPANQWLIDTYGETAEVVLEWWKNDIDDEGRDWVTKRTLERLIKLHLVDQPLETGLIYLGEGEYAPIPLSGLEARLAGRRQVGIRELAADVDGWEARLAAAARAADEGTNDTDTVHQVFANAEVSQLRDHLDVVARLLRHLPPKLRATYLVGQTPEKQRVWVEAFAKVAELAKRG